MQTGIDSYSYHRLFGDVRVGETPSAVSWPTDHHRALEHATICGAEWLFLETCFLTAPTIDAFAVDVSGSGPRIGFSWGHGWPKGQSHGLHGGRRADAPSQMHAWIDAATRLGHPLLRVTAGSPDTRGAEPVAPLLARLAPVLRRAAVRAWDAGVVLALENHGDLRARDVLELLERTDHPGLGVCLDNVNLIRVGDDMIEGTRLLGEAVRIVQLKDCAPGDPAIRGGPASTVLGEGSLDLDRVIAVLGQAGFNGPVCVELATLGETHEDELAMVERSIAWLRKHLPPSQASS